MNQQTKKYVYIQPEYVKKFQCNGQACGAKCCRHWNIAIDSATYQKYSRLKPKSKARQLTDNIKFSKEHGTYLIRHDAEDKCPMLTPDYWCSVQRRYGESFLSNTCRAYPRVAYFMLDYYERSLSLTCPLAAELILSSTEPMSFEQIELDEHQHAANGLTNTPNLPRELIERFFTVQYAAISILQSRNLSLDGRLIVLGFYLDRLEELIKNSRLDEIEKLSAVYSSEEFLNGEAQRLIDSIEFNAENYIRTMFKILDSLYGAEAMFKNLNSRYIDAVSDALDIAVDKNKDASLSELVKNYRRLDDARKDFLDRNSIKLEHYLVNEFFLGLYPWKINPSISQNYGAFVATYKIIELIALSLEVQWRKWHGNDSEPPTEYQLPATLSGLAINVDHNKNYLKCLIAHFDKDILSIMKSLL